MRNENFGASEKVQMGYGFTPGAGRRNASHQDDPLAELFYNYLEWMPFKEVDETSDIDDRPWLKSIQKRIYRKVMEIPGMKEKSPEEINSLVVRNASHPDIAYSGLFLTACYNAIESPEIVFDIDLEEPIKLVGYGLAKGKTLLIKSNTGCLTGKKSEGALVNYAKNAGNTSLGSDSECDIINFGEASDIGSGRNSDVNSRTINYGIAESIRRDKVFVNFGVADTHGYSVVGINMNHIGTLSGLALTEEVLINFGTVEDVSDSFNGILLNLGSMQENMNIGWLPIEDAKDKPKLKEYLEGLRDKLEKYRTAGYPECLEVFEVIDKEVGSIEELGEKLKGFGCYEE